MSAEGVWAIQTGEDDRFENMTAGGVVALENGRVIGGDQRVAVTGSYVMEGSVLRATLRIRTWNPAFASYTRAYGIVGPFDLEVEAYCRLGDARWVGHSWVPGDASAVRQALVLTRMIELPCRAAEGQASPGLFSAAEPARA